MNRIFFNDFVNVKDKEEAKQTLLDLQKKYPASSMVSFFCLKLLSPRTLSHNRNRMLLTLSDIHRFYRFSAEFEPVVHTERPRMNVLLTTVPKEPKQPGTQPVFVRHPAENHNQRQELIDQLIEKFSKDAPKIIYSPETHDAEANYGADSLEEDPNIVSETLARIYAEQGCSSKAVQMYEILKLHFPEKNRYFAAQIEKLQKEQDIQDEKN